MENLFSPWLVTDRNGRTRFRRMSDDEKLAMLRAVAALQIPDECCLWPTDVGHDGYGRLTLNRRRVVAHRALYEAVHGPLPPELVCDHFLLDLADYYDAPLCSRACCCIHHVFPTSGAANTLSGRGVTAVHARQTACGQCGQPFDIVTSDGGRGCRSCTRAKQAVRNQRYRDRHPPWWAAL
jgi:hypothetical protein